VGASNLESRPCHDFSADHIDFNELVLLRLIDHENDETLTVVQKLPWAAANLQHGSQAAAAAPAPAVATAAAAAAAETRDCLCIGFTLVCFGF